MQMIRSCLLFDGKVSPFTGIHKPYDSHLIVRVYLSLQYDPYHTISSNVWSSTTVIHSSSKPDHSGISLTRLHMYFSNRTAHLLYTVVASLYCLQLRKTNARSSTSSFGAE